MSDGWRKQTSRALGATTAQQPRNSHASVIPCTQDVSKTTSRVVTAAAAAVGWAAAATGGWAAAAAVGWAAAAAVEWVWVGLVQGAWFNVKTLRPELRKVLEQWNGGVRTFQQLAKTGVRTLITVLTPGC